MPLAREKPTKCGLIWLVAPFFDDEVAHYRQPRKFVNSSIVKVSFTVITVRLLMMFVHVAVRVTDTEADDEVFHYQRFSSKISS